MSGRYPGDLSEWRVPGGFKWVAGTQEISEWRVPGG